MNTPKNTIGKALDTALNILATGDYPTTGTDERIKLIQKAKSEAKGLQRKALDTALNILATGDYPTTGTDERIKLIQKAKSEAK